MTDGAESDPEDEEIALEYELDAAPEKVWRAIATPAFREQWLPAADLAEQEPIVSVPGVEVRYRMRDDGEPPLNSTVTFQIEPGPEGGTLFRVIHRIEALAGACANDNGGALSLAVGLSQPCQFSASYPLVGEDQRRGVAQPWIVSLSAARTPNSEVRATPHSGPPPQEGAGAPVVDGATLRQAALAA